MNYHESVQYLYGLGHEVLALKFGLENITALTAALDEPHRAFDSILIAGTNGKGSTAAMLDAILSVAGIRHGLYTSPHLIEITERISVDGQEITPAEFAELATRVRQTSEALVAAGTLPALPTFFEQVTATAFCHFARRGVPLVILEVGMGGRLDATNLVQPLISVITPIAYDHQKYLGDTLTAIAGEKAAIIKRGAAAVVAPQPAEAMDVIMNRCLAEQVLPVFVDPPSEVEIVSGKRIGVTIDGRREYKEVTLGLRGRHQAINAAVAVAAAEELSQYGYTLNRSAIITGLEQANWPGRLEIISGAPLVLLDGAHNPAGAQTLREFLDEFCPNPITLIFGAMADKALAEMAELLFPVARHVVLTQLNETRSARATSLAQLAVSLQANVIFTQTVEQALHGAQALTPRDGLICVAGSLHLVGAIKAVLAQERIQPEGKR